MAWLALIPGLFGNNNGGTNPELERVRAQRDAAEKKHQEVLSLLNAERAKTQRLNEQLQRALLDVQASKEKLDSTIKAFQVTQENAQRNIQRLETENAELRKTIDLLSAKVDQLMLTLKKQQIEFNSSLEERDKLNQKKLEELDKKFKSEQLDRDEAYKKIIADREAAFQEKFNVMMASIARQNVATRKKRSTLEQASRQLGMVNEFARRFHEERLQEIQRRESYAGTGGVKLAAMLAEADKKFEDEIKMLKTYVVSRANPSGDELQRMVEGVKEGLVSKYDLRGGSGFGSGAPKVHASPAFIQRMSMDLLG